MEHERDIICNWCARDNPQRFGKEVERIGNRKKSRDHLNYSIVKISHNTEKGPGDLKKLAVIQAPVKDHQLTLVGKTRKETTITHLRNVDREIFQHFIYFFWCTILFFAFLSIYLLRIGNRKLSQLAYLHDMKWFYKICTIISSILKN